MSGQTGGNQWKARAIKTGSKKGCKHKKRRWNQGKAGHSILKPGMGIWYPGIWQNEPAIADTARTEFKQSLEKNAEDLIRDKCDRQIQRTGCELKIAAKSRGRRHGMLQGTRKVTLHSIGGLCSEKEKVTSFMTYASIFEAWVVWLN